MRNRDAIRGDVHGRLFHQPRKRQAGRQVQQQAFDSLLGEAAGGGGLRCCGMLMRKGARVQRILSGVREKAKTTCDTAAITIMTAASATTAATSEGARFILEM